MFTSLTYFNASFLLPQAWGKKKVIFSFQNHLIALASPLFRQPQNLNLIIQNPLCKHQIKNWSWSWPQPWKFNAYLFTWFFLLCLNYTPIISPFDLIRDARIIHVGGAWAGSKTYSNHHRGRCMHMRGWHTHTLNINILADILSWNKYHDQTASLC